MKKPVKSYDAKRLAKIADDLWSSDTIDEKDERDGSYLLQLIYDMKEEIERLKEIEWMHNDLCK